MAQKFVHELQEKKRCKEMGIMLSKTKSDKIKILRENASVIKEISRKSV